MRRLIRVSAVVEVDENDNDSCVFAATEEINNQVTVRDGNERVRSMIITDILTNRSIYEKLANGKVRRFDG